MRPVRKSQHFQFIPLARQFSILDSFCWHLLFQCQGYSRDRGLKCICVYIRPSLNLCRSEVSWLGPASGMT